MAFSDPRPVLTVGHGHLGLGDFVALLRGAGVEVLVDVRQRSWNPFIPTFARDTMKMDLLQAGIVYFFQGHRLGPRPADPAFLDGDGSVRYAAWERSHDFAAALDWVVARSREGRVCLMAGQPEPWGCHRHFLLAQALLARGVAVLHLMGDGSLEPAAPDILHWRQVMEAHAGGG